MRKLVVLLTFLSVSVFGVRSVLAVPVLTLTPDPETVHPPANVLVDITISGLGDTLLGAFNFDVVYDPRLLVFTSELSRPGTALGDVLEDEAIFDLASTPGLLQLAEVSLLDASGLAALQNDTFILATLGFFVPNLPPTGQLLQTPLRTDHILLSDTLGNTVAPQIDPITGDIFSAVANPVATLRLVPLPSSLVLLGIGLLGLVIIDRKRPALTK